MDNGVSVASFVVSWPMVDVKMLLVLGWTVPFNRVDFWELLVVVGVDGDVVWKAFLECLEDVGVNNGNFRVVNSGFELKFDRLESLFGWLEQGVVLVRTVILSSFGRGVSGSPAGSGGVLVMVEVRRRANNLAFLNCLSLKKWTTTPPKATPTTAPTQNSYPSPNISVNPLPSLILPNSLATSLLNPTKGSSNEGRSSSNTTKNSFALLTPPEAKSSKPITN